MRWCETLQDKLEKNDNINYEEIFHKTAKDLMENHALVANGKEYDFADIEFYYYNKNKHEDPYVHCNNEQKMCNKFYFHASGFDITFGNQDYHGGILIRGIKCQEGTYINGPIKSIEAIFEIEKYMKNIRQELKDKITIKNKKYEPKIINLSTRIGLRAHHLDRETSYIFKHYRFVDVDESHNYKEKTKMDYYNQVDNETNLNIYKKDRL